MKNNCLPGLSTGRPPRSCGGDGVGIVGRVLVLLRHEGGKGWNISASFSIYYPVLFILSVTISRFSLSRLKGPTFCAVSFNTALCWAVIIIINLQRK